MLTSFFSSNKEVASYEKRLSICLKSNGFSFSVIRNNEELISLGDVECDITAPMSQLLTTIKTVFDEAKIPLFGMREAELVFPTRHFVWIPIHLYDETKNREYIEALYKIEIGEAVFSEYNAANAAQLIFTAAGNVVSAFRIAIPGMKVRAQHGKMVNSEAVEASHMKSLIVMNVRDGMTDYAVFCNKKLQISNTYDCANFEEAVYHAINLNKQFHLDDVQLTLAMCGDVDRNSYTMAKSFFKDVALYTGRNLQLDGESLRSAPIYRYALILS